VRAMVHAARPLADYPGMLDALTADAIRALAAHAAERILAQGEPPEGTLAALKELFADDASRPTWVNAFRGERAFWEGIIRAKADGRLTIENAQTRGLGALFDNLRSWTGWPALDRTITRVTGGGFTLPAAAALLRYRT